MILSGHQPTYLPGIILFTKIALSDAFMFVGHCQFGNRSYHKRNRIRNISGDLPVDLIIPIKHNFGQSIDDAEFAGDHWRAKHLKSIEVNYKKRPFFNNYFPQLESVIGNSKEFPSLSSLNKSLIEMICVWLGIVEIDKDGNQTGGVKVHDSKKFNLEYGDANGMLVAMCLELGATEYLSSPGELYVDQKQMFEHGISHHWLKFTHPVYDQGFPEFQTNLSVIDLLFNCGPEAGRIVRSAGHVG